VTYSQLRSWARKRHPNKNAHWIADKYWHTNGNKNWEFSTRGKEGVYRLLNHTDTPIERHIKVQGTRSPYDGDLMHWSTRLGRHPEMPSLKAKLLKAQKGKCNHCGLTFRDGDLLETDHIIPITMGGDNSIKNKQLLHKHCHDLKTANDGSLNRTHDKGLIREKPWR
jgi:RNA-directed DNA polymerase